MKRELVIVLDFGGQYNQLVARRVRECNVYCEIYSYKTDIEKIKEAGYDVITPVIVCNPDDFSEIQMAESGDVAQGDAILNLKK